ncbi:hypothetical protein JOB18_024028 [Solea senegalensis]|uniref:Uncharacterized protein n=1 Tax=Solea senegalensis TaxID=28829 RepID=A0AAV6Q6Q3_SOLSE|nr:hypothetical protein JOB18_024028 [Solea senegalensis]
MLQYESDQHLPKVETEAWVLLVRLKIGQCKKERIRTIHIFKDDLKKECKSLQTTDLHFHRWRSFSFPLRCEACVHHV